MTSGAKKEKARRKKRAEKLLEEEKARQAPVSTPTPIVTPATSIHAVPIPTLLPTLSPSIPKLSVVDDSDPEPYDWYPPANVPMFDASTLIFDDSDDDETYGNSFRAAASWRGPAHYPEHIRAYLYDTPTDTSFYDTPELAAIPTAPVATSVLALRDFSALCTESHHPWRTIRRRNHRLLPQRREQRPFPRSLPKRTVVSAPGPNILSLHEDISLPMSPLFEAPPLPRPPPQHGPGLSLRPADLLDLLPSLHPIGSDDPFHLDNVPSIEFPPPSFCPCPADHCIDLPADTEYGAVIHELAYACSRVLPPAVEVGDDLCNLVWPPLVFPDGSFIGNPEARLDLLTRLPPDQLVFLLAIVHMGRLEHHFALLFDGAITDFARAWVHHCELIGEAG
ncbi:hypothetical protein B0H13DRAFT_2437621 [Mycena leptocephala]|nr:hypothetical protein B0H13DRAFT_2437621 [Mycena leptocephala]